MKSYSSILIFALLSSTWSWPSHANDLTIQLHSEPKVGDKVLANIDAPGDVLIESDIAQATFKSEGHGLRQVDLGNGKRAELGFHTIRVVSGNIEKTMLITVLSAAAKTPQPSASGLSSGEQTLLVKFFGLLRTHKGKYYSSWPKGAVLTANVVKITTVGTLGIVCAAEPSKLTCIPLAGTAADLAAELMFGYLRHSVSEMNSASLLTADEAKTLRYVLDGMKAAQIVMNVALGSGLAEKAIEGMEIITLILDEKSGLQLVIGLQKDSAGKAAKFIQILKKVN